MFIDPISLILLRADVPFSIYLVEYRLESFVPELFASEAIKPPDNFHKCVEKRQAEYLAGRCCAKWALKSLDIVDFDILSAKDRSPIWPAGIAGSITHSSSFAAAAASFSGSCAGVGIDIEKVFDVQRLKIKEHICSSSEMSYLQSLTSKIDVDVLYTLAFSAKESLYKALYPMINVFFYFNSVEVTSIDADKGLIMLRVTKNIGEKVMVGTQFECYYQPINQAHYLTYCAITSPLSEWRCA